MSAPTRPETGGEEIAGSYRLPHASQQVARYICYHSRLSLSWQWRQSMALPSLHSEHACLNNLQETLQGR